MMAEEVGFEPTVRVNVRRFSRPVHSTTLPLLRRSSFSSCELILKVHFLRFFKRLSENANLNGIKPQNPPTQQHQLLPEKFRAI